MADLRHGELYDDPETGDTYKYICGGGLEGLFSLGGDIVFFPDEVLDRIRNAYAEKNATDSGDKPPAPDFCK